MRMLPEKPPSSSPIACSIVDLPEPEGPSSATISPGAIAKSTPRSTSIRTPPCSKLRARLRTATTGSTCASLIAQHLDGVGVRRLPRWIERREEAEHQCHHADHRDLHRVGPARQLGEEADRGIPQV